MLGQVGRSSASLKALSADENSAENEIIMPAGKVLPDQHPELNLNKFESMEMSAIALWQRGGGPNNNKESSSLDQSYLSSRPFYVRNLLKK